MGSIADLFFKAQLEDGQLQIDAKKSGDKAGQNLGSGMASSFKKNVKDLGQGIKLGAGIAAFGLLEGAIGGVVSGLGDAIQAARDDEESQARLGAALKANIPNWDGNTKAIEATIASRQKLGFTDEEQRKALALLVVATKDHAKALEIERTAMDLARLKGISLEEASAALIKIEGGQFRALKALGIILPKNATATEALAAVQKAAAGSAEDFANTSQGKLLASQIAVSEAMEKLGYIIMPAVTEIMVTLSEAAGPVVDGITAIIGAAQKATEWLDNLAGANKDAAKDSDFLGDKTTALGQALHWLAAQPGAVADAINGTSDAMVEADKSFDRASESMNHAMSTVTEEAKDLAKGGGTSFTSLGNAAQEMKNKIKRQADAIATRLKDLTVTLLGEAQALIDGYYDPIIAQEELRVAKDDIATARVEVNAARKAVAATKAGTTERREAQATLDQALLNETRSEQALDNMRANLLAAGQLSAKDQKAWLADLQKRYKTATGDAKAKLQSLINKIKELQGLNASGVKITVTAGVPGKSGATKPRATGGPVTAGRPYLVNENTPNSELWVPDISGRVLSGAVPAMAMAGGGGGFVQNNNISVLAPVPKRTPMDIVTQLRRTTRMGYFEPSNG